ncbi:MAG: hypothetical protein DRN61_06470 [Thaumarchaeota archaeon]|nr:MAG: hypothetical protein DRN61_06470 [Nitrososphaerota archaeon]
MRRSSSGISPVVATVILVAIAIVIAIAVAFWASGLVGVFTRFEKIEITAVYWEDNHFTLVVKNTGSAAATIDDIYVNGVPLGGSGTSWGISSGSTYLTPGATAVLTVNSAPGGSFTSGVTYEIAVHTSSGKLYPASAMKP